MKKIILALCAAMTLVSCGIFNGSAASTQPSQKTTETQVAQTTNNTVEVSTTDATKSGQAAGDAILALYKQYQLDGKYNYSNLTNIANTLMLIQYCQGLKENIKDGNYRKQFGQGLMSSATGLINKDNVEQVTDNLSTIVDKYADKAATATSTAAAKLETASQTASSIANLLSLFQSK